ncbi:MAG: hypothetical protein WAO76_09205 [Georgfuchsia sp.]
MQIEHTEASIVVIGNFRPDSFRLKALADAKVISQKDADRAEILVLIPGQAVNFNLQWSTVLVDSSRFQVTTTEAPYIRICDLVLKALNDIDTKFSVTALGINYTAHFNMGTYKARDEIGLRVAPPNAWGDWGKAVYESISNKPASRLHGGLMSMTMRLPFNLGTVGGWRDVSVTPSDKVAGHGGIKFKSNHHFILSSSLVDEAQSPDNPTKEDTEGLLLRALSEGFDESIKECEAIFNQMVVV